MVVGKRRPPVSTAQSPRQEHLGMPEHQADRPEDVPKAGADAERLRRYASEDRTLADLMIRGEAVYPDLDGLLDKQWHQALD